MKEPAWGGGGGGGDFCHKEATPPKLNCCYLGGGQEINSVHETTV